VGTSKLDHLNEDIRALAFQMSEGDRDGLAFPSCSCWSGQGPATGPSPAWNCGGRIWTSDLWVMRAKSTIGETKDNAQVPVKDAH